MKKFGVAVPESLESRIMMLKRDGQSRSDRIREMLRLASTAEHVLFDHHLELSAEERERFVEEAVSRLAEDAKSADDLNGILNPDN